MGAQASLPALRDERVHHEPHRETVRTRRRASSYATVRTNLHQIATGVSAATKGDSSPWRRKKRTMLRWNS